MHARQSLLWYAGQNPQYMIAISKRTPIPIQISVFLLSVNHLNRIYLHAAKLKCSWRLPWTFIHNNIKQFRHTIQFHVIKFCFSYQFHCMTTFVVRLTIESIECNKFGRDKWHDIYAYCTTLLWPAYQICLALEWLLLRRCVWRQQIGRKKKSDRIVLTDFVWLKNVVNILMWRKTQKICSKATRCQRGVSVLLHLAYWLREYGLCRWFR